MAERSRFDLLLTDVVMRGMGGGELAERMRERHPDVPVLFVSGFPDDPLVQQLVADRDATLLPKPLRIESLAEHVRRLLDG